jgi:hypothetical protein
MIAVICCTNIGEEGCLGLVVNFSAAIIISELDDIIMATGNIQAIKEFILNYQRDESLDLEPVDGTDY